MKQRILSWLFVIVEYFWTTITWLL